MKKIIALFLSLFCCGDLKSEEINWYPSTVISTKGQDATEPQIAIDSLGNSAAVWVENGFVMFSQCSTRGKWSYPPSILSKNGSSQPQLKMDFKGNITVVWIQEGIIYANSKAFDGFWGSSVALSSSNAATPQLAIDGSGNSVAVWTREGKVEASTKLYEADWQASPDVLSAGEATYPNISISDDGKVMIVWNEFDGRSYSILSAYKTIPSDWRGPEIITSSLPNNPYSYISLNDSGKGIAVWYKYTTSSPISRSLEYAFWSENNSWSSPDTLTTSRIANPEARGVMAGIDTEGNTIFLWKTEYLEDSFGIRTNIINSDGTKEPPSDLVAFNLYTYAADLKLVPSGIAVVSYMSYDQTSSILSIQATNANIAAHYKGHWEVPQSISPTSINGYPHTNATQFENTLNVAITWLSYNGKNRQVTAITGLTNLLLPPSELAVTQIANNFGIFTEYCNKVVWQASPSPEVKGYIIYRNGQYFTEVDANQPLVVFDHNTDYKESVTYGIASTNNAESQSKTVTVTFP